LQSECIPVNFIRNPEEEEEGEEEEDEEEDEEEGEEEGKREEDRIRRSLLKPQKPIVRDNFRARRISSQLLASLTFLDFYRTGFVMFYLQHSSIV